MKHWAIILLLALGATATAADARVRLQDDKIIENGLRLVSIGKMLYRNCDDIKPRRFRAFQFARSLQSRARKMGYSDAEIDAYLDSDKDKDRIKGQARKYLEARGVNFSQPATFCKVGRAEIAAETTVGNLLWAR